MNTTSSITFRLAPEQAARLEALARKNDRSVSAELRLAVQDRLAEAQGEQERAAA